MSGRRDVTFPEDGTLGRLTRALRHPLRAIAAALAAVALVWAVASGWAVAAAAVGSVVGVALGEALGRSRLRLGVVLGGVVLLGLGGWLASRLLTATEVAPDLFGPGTALTLAAVLRYGGITFLCVGGLRVLAVRRPALLGLEVAAMVAAWAVAFAAHRDGVIARPLWLSDWAWQEGIDPGEVFFALGATAAVVVAALLVLETRGGRAVSSLVALPLLGLLAVSCLEAVGGPEPDVDDGIGLTTDEEGGEPPPDPRPEGPDERPGGGGGGDGGAPGPSDAGTGDGGVGVGDAGTGHGDAGGASGVGDAGGVPATPRDAGHGGGPGGGDGGVDGGASGAPLDGGPSPGMQDGGAGSGGGDAGSDGGVGTSPDAGASSPPSTPSESLPAPPSGAELTDRMDEPSTSPMPMAVVVFEQDYSPPSQSYYFRQEAWSQLTGTRLAPAEAEGADPDTLATFPTRPVEVAAPPPGERTEVSGTVALLLDHQHPFALESPVRFAPASNPNPERFSRAYRFSSLAQETEYGQLLGRGAGDAAWSDDLRAMYLESHPDPRFAELANRILDEELQKPMHRDPFARALAIKLWLDRELTYSTKARRPNVEDPTVDFLFGDRIGYCVHFAHAAVFLWRAAGIPSRVGTGYMVPEANRQGGSAVLLRSGDAHAWPELYLKGVGWVVLDIAAEENLDEPGEPVDEELQRMLGEMARDTPADPEEAYRDEEPGFSVGIDFWVLAAILAGLCLLALYAVKLWRWGVPFLAGLKAQPRVAYRAALDRLAEVGLARRRGETREAFAVRVGELAPSFARLTTLHVASRLGTGAANDPAAEWHRLRKDVFREVRRSVPWWRRLLGRLHPASFFDAR